MAGRGTKPHAPPVVANSDALEVAKAAAAAVGLTVQELCDLVVDSGLTALPPEDGITQKYTLDDLGKRLWSEMSELSRPGRRDWFEKLSEPAQVALIVQLRNAGFSAIAINNDLGVGVDRVRQVYSQYASELGAQVVAIRLDTIAGQMTMASEKAQEMAMAAGDYQAFWRIQNEYTKSLQSLGIVDSAIRRVEVTHKMTDEAKAEIEALVALENKRRIGVELNTTAKEAESTPLPLELTRDESDDEA